MDSVVGAITKTIPISQFNRGLAGKIFEEVKRTGPKVVVKNNIPEIVLVPPEEYVREKEELENLRLMNLALERYKKSDPSEYLSQKDVDDMFGFSADDLKNCDEVDFE